MATNITIRENPFSRRCSGVLLHVTSLPGPENTGIIGQDAFRFVDFLKESGFTIWQTLPLGPTHEDGSPYQCLSAHACDTGFISPEWLKDQNLLDESPVGHSRKDKERYLKQAFDVFQKLENKKSYQSFLQKHGYWLNDFCLFMAIRETCDHTPWWQWEKPLRDRNQNTINKFSNEYKELISYYQFKQYIVFSQWQELKDYANKKGVLLFGDMPIYVALDSADVWANRELFLLDSDGKPTYVAGVPPDYFSETGQHWGNPIYNWEIMQNNGFLWWSERMRSQYELFDLIRIDHFRGLEAYWQIPGNEKTAINGKWVLAPGKELLKTLQDTFHDLPLVAEDLGTITDEVHQLRSYFNIPGMEVLQFAFDGDPNNLYLPHNHKPNSIVYTGTHDNNTTVGWFNELSTESRNYIRHYLDSDHFEMPWSLIKAALASVANVAILPMQDILGLGVENRMNTPGTTEGNWTWRFEWSQVHENLAADLRQLNHRYDRL
ncbi:4-alpha-glucanotransferase [Kaarinaea lacus]